MRICFGLFLVFATLCGVEVAASEKAVPLQKAFVLPIQDDIATPMVYLVRRGVKEAVDAKADLLVLDMDTNGGRLDATEEIMDILSRFPGKTVTYVNRKAFSAGAFISVATQKIYMAPQSVIGAAAPILMAPGGTGVQEMPDTMEVKTTSALRALVRTAAEKNGHNVDVVEAMIDKSKELTINGDVLSEKGQILTLTDLQAAKEYGDPPKPLLSAGTVESLELLLKQLGHGESPLVVIEPTGAEKLGAWLNAISPLLLIIGIIGIYIEFKTPGFGLPGIVGIVAFALYFLGGYAAGLSGLEWLVIFILGLALLVVEFFIYPGTIFIGLIGASLVLTALIMAMVDLWPSNVPGLPSLPPLTGFRRPLEILSTAIIGSVIIAILLARFLPKIPIYRTLVSQSASGMQTEVMAEQEKVTRQGQTGLALSSLCPGGKAQFGEQILDVISEGEMIAKGTQVRIIGYSGRQAIVEVLG